MNAALRHLDSLEPLELARVAAHMQNLCRQYLEPWGHDRQQIVHEIATVAREFYSPELRPGRPTRRYSEAVAECSGRVLTLARTVRSDVFYRHFFEEVERLCELLEAQRRTIPGARHSGAVRVPRGAQQVLYFALPATELDQAENLDEKFEKVIVEKFLDDPAYCRRWYRRQVAGILARTVPKGVWRWLVRAACSISIADWVRRWLQ